MEALGLLFFQILLVVLNAKGYQLMFNWIVPAAFPGVPQITVANAFGLVVLVGMLTLWMSIRLDKLTHGDNRTIREKAQGSVEYTLMFWIGVGMCWLVKTFWM